jgi:hypothetical protein
MDMNLSEREANVTPRRKFLSQLSVALSGATLALAKTSGAEEPPPNVSDSRPRPMPTIQLGEHQVSRLIAGSNPINGYSYMGPFMDQHMREYFTTERIIKFLRRCETAGINTHQFSHPEKMAPIIQTLRDHGSRMRFICLHATGPQQLSIKQVVRSTDPIAIVHHGGRTDKLFREDKQQEVRDFVRRVRDAGVLAGVSAHNPACIKQIADEGWPVDFFMTCFYYLTRSPKGLEKMPSVSTVQIGYPFFAADPTVMTSVMQQVDQPCLGFKILAAGRKCHNKQSVREAFKFAFERIKPRDGIIVGMYPRFQDQIEEDVESTRRFGERQKT